MLTVDMVVCRRRACTSSLCLLQRLSATAQCLAPPFASPEGCLVYLWASYLWGTLCPSLKCCPAQGMVGRKCFLGCCMSDVTRAVAGLLPLHALDTRHSEPVRHPSNVCGASLSGTVLRNDMAVMKCFMSRLPPLPALDTRIP